MKRQLIITCTLALYCFFGGINAVSQANNRYTIEVKRGNEAALYAQTILKFKFDNFQGWPYFYDVTKWLKEEEEYIASSQGQEHSLLAIAKYDGEVIGLITGSPLKIHHDLIGACTLKDFNTSEYYYYGEVMVQQAHRGNHLVTKMFEQANKIVKTWGYKHASLVTVIRSDDDARKPDNALNSGLIWAHVGYKKTDITLPYTWPTFTDKACTTSSMIENKLVLWIKDLEQP